MQSPHPTPAAARSAPHETALAARFARIRAATLALAAPLSEADCQVQSMPDASPVKWHLAHITWFFETFVLEPHEPNFRPHHPAYRVLFNSYYNGIGEQHPRPQRGLVTRPSLAEVVAYRAAVDERMQSLLQREVPPAMAQTVELGLQHEQQHQELLLTDVLHLLSCNPMEPVYHRQWPLAAVAPAAAGWVDFEGGVVEIGHAGHAGDNFAFDNEGPRHQQLLHPHALARRLVTHGEWADFIADGGYAEPRWWLAAGWDWVRSQRIEAPLYWRRHGAGAPWHSFTLHGRVPIDPHTPITHISLYEADAYARWLSAQTGEPLRLPTEFEWEHAAAPLFDAGLARGNFMESKALHPVPAARTDDGLVQMFGDVWEWTSSNYGAYPGFKAWDGAVGEYNAKFMVNQTVLRGGSCATPRSHIRASYRNFFPADARWQFNGLRLAKDLD
ncbi:MAG: ergothioneine biosynthesis protein EgtB [Rubrivivax sp.]